MAKVKKIALEKRILTDNLAFIFQLSLNHFLIIKEVSD